MGPAASHRVSDYSCLAPSPSRAMVAEQISYHAPGTWPCTLHGPRHMAQAMLAATGEYLQFGP
jgi:hypothetical protein